MEYKSQQLTIGFCAFLICSCLFLGRVIAQSMEDQLQVLTYNIHHCNPPSVPGKIDLLAIAKVIKASGADLVALQEVDVHTGRSGKELDQAAELGRLTGMYHFFAKAIDHDGGDYGVAILSKYPFLKTTVHQLPAAAGLKAEQRVFATVTVAPRAGVEIRFASTHLDLKPEHRALQVAFIQELLAGVDRPIIIGGDFNAVPNTDVIRFMDEHFSRSQIENGYTVPVINPRREIDYVFYRSNNVLRVVDHQVIQEQYASDHLPIYVAFTYVFSELL